jgi:hypothetical protein
MASLNPVLSVVFTIKTQVLGARQQYAQVVAIYDGVQLLSIRDVLTVKKPEWSSPKFRIVEWGAPAFSCEWADGGVLEVRLMDREEPVEEVQMVPYPMSVNDMVMPNEACTFKIQNACGSWEMPTPRNLRSMSKPLTASSAMHRQMLAACCREEQLTKKKEKVPKKRAREMPNNRIQQDSVHALSGTFVVSENKHKVDFRGVRSFKLMLEDWLMLLGNNSRKRMIQAGISCSIYMVLLKANMGYTLQLTTHQSYVILNMYGVCSAAEVRKREGQVCDVVELRDINWDYYLWADGDHSMVKLGVTTLEISRKGGTVMRIVFSKGTLWDEMAEAEVLASAGMLWTGIRRVLSGECSSATDMP